MVKKEIRNKPRIKFHVCIPLYRGIPKEMQSGWTRMGPHGVLEWDNSTNLTEYVLRGMVKDKNLYCGTCGRLMVKGRKVGMQPLENTKVIKLV